VSLIDRLLSSGVFDRDTVTDDDDALLAGAAAARRVRPDMVAGDGASALEALSAFLFCAHMSLSLGVIVVYVAFNIVRRWWQ
jgi:hypothetical protein